MRVKILKGNHPQRSLKQTSSLLRDPLMTTLGKLHDINRDEHCQPEAKLQLELTQVGAKSSPGGTRPCKRRSACRFLFRWFCFDVCWENRKEAHRTHRACGPMPSCPLSLPFFCLGGSVSLRVESSSHAFQPSCSFRTPGRFPGVSGGFLERSGSLDGEGTGRNHISFGDWLAADAVA